MLNDRIYKPGQLYRITCCTIETHILLLSTSDSNNVIGVMLTDTIMKKFESFDKRSVIGKVIVPNLLIMKFDQEGHLLYNMTKRTKTIVDITEDANFQPVDNVLEYIRDIESDKMDYILSNLKHIGIVTN